MVLKSDVKEIAKKCGVSTQAVYDWKSGKYMPRASKLKIIAKLENTTVDKLFK